MSDIQRNLIREYADSAAKNITQKTIRAMQRITDTLSAEDSGLYNAWDEICVQAQGEDSYFRDVYDEMLQQIVIQYAAELPERDLQAIWLQTESGWDWHWDIENPCVAEDDVAAKLPTGSQIIPCDIDEIGTYIVQTYILPQADVYSNRRIKAFLAQYEQSKYEMD